jgi:hypothetical protein
MSPSEKQEVTRKRSAFRHTLFIGLIAPALLFVNSWHSKSASPMRDLASAKIAAITQLDLELESLLQHPEARREAVNELIDSYRPRLRTLRRSIRAFHYGWRTSMESGSTTKIALDAKRLGPGVTSLQDPRAYQTPLELQPPELDEYFRKKAGLFFGSQNHSPGAVAGPGLYAAIDPIQSQDYAGSPWVLVEIETPAGTNYINEQDLQVVNSDFFQKRLKHIDWRSIALQDGNGYVRTQEGDYYLLDFEVVTQSPTLLRLMTEALQELKVDFLLYAWRKPSITLCKLSGVGGPNSRSTMNFINPEFITRGGKLRVYVAELEANPPREKMKHYRELLEVIELSPFITPDESSEKYGKNPGRFQKRFLYGNRKEEAEHAYPADLIFFRTYGWNQPLKRKSRWTPHYVSEQEAIAYSRFMNQNKSERANSSRGELTLRNLVPIGDELAIDIDRDYARLFPPSEHARIQDFIRRTTYGCDPKHPEERLIVRTD